MRPRRILVNGLGRVGRALLRSWDRVRPGALLVAVADSRGAIAAEAGLDPALAIRRKKAGEYDEGLPLGTELIRRVEPDVLVELVVTDLETGEPAVPDIRCALGQGTAVITSAKSHQMSRAVMAELALLSRETLFFDHAAILAGIPATEIMAGVGMRLRKVEGVLNGTTNFMLARLRQGLSFQAALQEAIERGFAERNWTYDIQGTDAAVKLVGLCKKFLAADLDLAGVERRGLLRGRLGIEGIDGPYLEALAGRGETVKLFAEAEEEKDGLRACVYPRVMPVTDPFASIEGFHNAIRLTGEMNRTPMTLFLSGPGAGADETASRVLGNLNHLLDLLEWRAGSP